MVFNRERSRGEEIKYLLIIFRSISSEGPRSSIVDKCHGSTRVTTTHHNHKIQC